MNNNNKIESSKKRGRPGKVYYRNEDDRKIKDEFLYYTKKKQENFDEADWKEKIRRLYEIESFYGKDFCDLKDDELIEGFKRMSSTKTIEKLIKCLNSYAKWYSEKNNMNLKEKYFTYKIGPSKDEIFNYINNKKVITYMPRNKMDFFEMLNKSDIEPREKMCIALIYEGFTLEEIIKIKVSDINSYEEKNKFGKNTKLIINELLSYYELNSNVLNKLDKELLYRRSRTTNLSKATISRVQDNLSDLKKQKKIKLSMKDIQDFSVITQLLKIEANKMGDVTNEEIKTAIKHSKHNDNLNPNSINQIKKMYKQFKIHFNINLDNIKNEIDEEDIYFTEKDIEIEENENDIKAWDKYPQGAKSIGEKNKERGDKGEGFAEEELNREYSEVGYKVEKVADDSGFDYQVLFKDKPIKIVEVKTLYKISNKFHITVNELDTADRYPNIYWIYLIIVGDDDYYEIRRIKNPIKELNIDIKGLRQLNAYLFDQKKCEIEIGSFTISLKNNLKFSNLVLK